MGLGAWSGCAEHHVVNPDLDATRPETDATLPAIDAGPLDQNDDCDDLGTDVRSGYLFTITGLSVANGNQVRGINLDGVVSDRTPGLCGQADNIDPRDGETGVDAISAFMQEYLLSFGFDVNAALEAEEHSIPIVVEGIDDPIDDPCVGITVGDLGPVVVPLVDGRIVVPELPTMTLPLLPPATAPMEDVHLELFVDGETLEATGILAGVIAERDLSAAVRESRSVPPGFEEGLLAGTADILRDGVCNGFSFSYTGTLRPAP